MIEKAIRWIRNKFGTLANGASTAGPVVLPPVDDATKARQEFDSAVESFSDFFRKIANNLHENAHLQQFITLGESFRKSGYRAGHWGVNDPNLEETAALHVRITKSLIDEKCQSNQRELESQVEILKRINTNANCEYDAKNGYYGMLNRAYRYSNRQFSLTLGFIYGFFSVVLVFADIPMALELSRRGFNLNAEEQSGIADLFAFGTQEGFVFHFVKVLTVNWEVVVLATGIAFCTIYIKIFYDDFIGVPLENLIKKASESPRADYEEIYPAGTEDASKEPSAKVDEDEEEASIKKKQITDRFNRLWWWRFFVKLTVLLVLFSTILVLGYFRYSVITSPRIADISPAAIFLTYSLLTLIFPIISGICASLSLNSFHNWREMRKAAKEKVAAEKAALDASDLLRVKEKEKESNKSFLEWLSKEETIGQLTNYLIYCYKSGYQFGYLYPEWICGGDLFTRAEALRHRNFTDPEISIIGGSPVKPVKLPQNALN